VFVVLLTLWPVASHAQTWCSTNFPHAVVCEDFDRYCPEPPPYPQACPPNMGWDPKVLWAKWKPTGRCGAFIAIDDSWFSSSPSGGKTNTQCGGDPGYAVRQLADEIRNAYGPQFGAAMGSDLNPLVLEFVINGQSGRGQYSLSYFELSHGGPSNLTDFAYSEQWCTDCKGRYGRYPIICQQENPPPACPPISQAPMYPSIAAGFVALLDTNPCHHGESYTAPHNYHLSFFDGIKWYRLRQGLFPGEGDFRIRRGENKIRITIRSTTLKVEMTCTYPNPAEYSWCEMPRGYLGPFSTMTLGYKHSCHLKLGEWVCRDIPDCVNGVLNGGVPSYDNIALYGGMGYAGSGACCFPDTSCLGLHQGDCAALGGEFAGSGTTCETVACCPSFLPDHNMDTQVDLQDFGWIQTCLAGPQVPAPRLECNCADLDGDGDVDQDDIAVFIRCLTGPGAPVDPACLVP